MALLVMALVRHVESFDFLHTRQKATQDKSIDLQECYYGVCDSCA